MLRVAGRRSTSARLPHARSAAGLLVAVSLLLAGLGVGMARAETPAQRIARLRAQAAKVQATIDRTNDQIEQVVEQYNANQEALAQTLARERQTRALLAQARSQLAGAQRVLGERMRSIYINGPVSGLEQLLEVRSLSDAVVMTRYQQSATESDARAIATVETSKAKLTQVATSLEAQQRAQEEIRAQLADQRKDIEARLAEQQRFLDRLTGDVKHAIEQEQQRQEELRRQALARKLAAERAAREKAAREAAAREAAAREAAARAAAAQQAQAQAQQAQAQQAPPQPAPDPVPSGSSSAARQAIAFARAQIGDPYQFGATGPDSWDCSGLMLKAFASAGISLPRTSAGQYSVGRHIQSMVDLRPGDMVFFAFNTGDPSTIHHVGLYIGGGLMIEAPHTGAFVRTASINRSGYLGGTRVTG
jgi:cell wall-associated NlpC family hydrolase